MLSILSLFDDERLTAYISSFLSPNESLRLLQSTKLLYDGTIGTGGGRLLSMAESSLASYGLNAQRTNAWIHWQGERARDLLIEAELACIEVRNTPRSGSIGSGMDFAHSPPLTTLSRMLDMNVVGEVDRDVGRTMPLHPFFRPAKKPSSLSSPSGSHESASALSAASLNLSPHSISEKREVSRLSEEDVVLSSSSSSSSSSSDSSHADVDEIRSPGISMLRCVLLAFSAARPDVAYCQGANYVAAILLIAESPPPPPPPSQYLSRKVPMGSVRRERSEDVTKGISTTDYKIGNNRLSNNTSSPSSYTTSSSSSTNGSSFLSSSLLTPSSFSIHRCAVATSLLLALNDRYGLCDLWRPGLPRLRSLGFTLSELAKSYTPLLHDHLNRIGIDFDILSAQWLLPLLSTVIPAQTLLSVWDNFFAFGWPALFKAAVALLLTIQDSLIEMDTDSSAVFFRTWREAVGRSESSPASAPARSLLALCPALAILYDPIALLKACGNVNISKDDLVHAEESYSASLLDRKASAMAQLVRQEQETTAEINSSITPAKLSSDAVAVSPTTTAPSMLISSSSSSSSSSSITFSNSSSSTATKKKTVTNTETDDSNFIMTQSITLPLLLPMHELIPSSRFEKLRPIVAARDAMSVRTPLHPGEAHFSSSSSLTSASKMKNHHRKRENSTTATPTTPRSRTASSLGPTIAAATTTSESNSGVNTPSLVVCSSSSFSPSPELIHGNEIASTATMKIVESALQAAHAIRDRHHQLSRAPISIALSPSLKCVLGPPTNSRHPFSNLVAKILENERASFAESVSHSSGAVARRLATILASAPAAGTPRTLASPGLETLRLHPLFGEGWARAIAYNDTLEGDLFGKFRERRLVIDAETGMAMVDLQVPDLLLSASPASLRLPGKVERRLAKQVLFTQGVQPTSITDELLQLPPPLVGIPSTPNNESAPQTWQHPRLSPDLVEGLDPNDSAPVDHLISFPPLPDFSVSSPDEGTSTSTAVIQYPSSCPSRLDTTPLFAGLARALAADLGDINDALSKDVYHLSTKIKNAGSALISLAPSLEKTRAALATSEERMRRTLEAKRETAEKLQSILKEAASKGGIPQLVPLPASESPASLSPSASSLSIWSDVSAAMSSPEKIRSLSSPPSSASTLLLSPPQSVESPTSRLPNSSPSQRLKRAGPEDVSSAMQAKESARGAAAAVKRYSILLSGIDAQVHEASAAWQRCVWAHTMEQTRVSELQQAKDALMTSLVEVSNQANLKQSMLLSRSLYALKVLWRAQQGE